MTSALIRICDLLFRATADFNEIRNTNLERNHVVLLLSYSVVKEPTSAKGRQSCQTLTSVSSGLVPFPVNPTRLTRTRLLSRFAAWKRSAGPCDSHTLQGPGILRSRRCLVNY